MLYGSLNYMKIFVSKDMFLKKELATKQKDGDKGYEKS